jgi:hypothetical protein
MKTIYSLKEFHSKAVEISGKKSDLVSVSVELGLFGAVVFSCYADGYIHYKGKTMEESLQRLYDAVHNPPQPNVDVEIDVEQSVEYIGAQPPSLTPQERAALPF